jgi:hypothetical protein
VKRNLSINLKDHVLIVELLSTVMKHDWQNISEIALKSLSQVERGI